MGFGTLTKLESIHAYHFSIQADSLVYGNHTAFQLARYEAALCLVLPVHSCSQSKSSFLERSNGLINVIVRHNGHHWSKELVPCDSHVERDVHHERGLKVRGMGMVGMNISLSTGQDACALCLGLFDDSLELVNGR